MKEGIQSRIKNAKIKEYGCYFLSILRKAELENCFELSENEIIMLYEDLVDNKDMTVDCLIINPVGVYKAALDIAGVGRCAGPSYIGVERADHPPSSGSYILCLQKPMYTHFVLSTEGKIWDPLDPARPGAAGYKTTSYRVFVEEKEAS